MLRILLLLSLIALPQPTLARAPKDRFIEVDLIAETAQPKPGERFWVGLRMVPKPGWHSYWTNPGEAGLPTLVEWTAPGGVQFGPLQHPAPTLIQVAGIASFVHEGPHVLLSQVSLDRDVKPGTPIPIVAQVSWGACSDKACVPERATLSLQLTAGNGAASPTAGLLQRALARVPRRAGPGVFHVSGDKLLAEVPAGIRLDAGRVRFFPDTNDALDAAEARVVSAPPLRIAAPALGSVPETLTGVVSDGSSAYRLRLDRRDEAVAQAAEELPETQVDRPVRATRDIKAEAPSEVPDRRLSETEGAAGTRAASMENTIPRTLVGAGILALLVATLFVYLRRRKARR